MSTEERKIKEEQLSKLKQLKENFANLHKEIGDLELRKHQVLGDIDVVKSEFKTFEAELIKDYGDNVVINLETGELKDKQKDGKNK